MPMRTRLLRQAVHGDSDEHIADIARLSLRRTITDVTRRVLARCQYSTLAVLNVIAVFRTGRNCSPESSVRFVARASRACDCPG
jgi:hypothetical protein